MNHALLKKVIYDQHETIKRSQIVPRTYQMERGLHQKHRPRDLVTSLTCRARIPIGAPKV